MAYPDAKPARKNSLFSFLQRPQPRQGLQDFALQRTFAPPMQQVYGADGATPRRDLYMMDRPLTVPTQAMPVSYILGNYSLPQGTTNLTGLAPLPEYNKQSTRSL